MSRSALFSEVHSKADRITSSSRVSPKRIRFCHFTTAHSSVKSRSFHRQCLPLAQAGIDVRYVAPFEHKESNGVSFVSVRCRKGRIRRALANPSLLRALLEQDADLYHFQDPELLPLAFVLKVVFGKRVIYDAYEDFPSMARATEVVASVFRPFAGKLIEFLELTAARCLDGIITADPLTLRRLAPAGKSRKLAFHNFPNLHFFPPVQPCPKKFDLVYRGGISERAGTLVLADALRILAERSRVVRALLLGYFDSPPCEQKVRNRIRELGLESSTEVSGRIDHEDMARVLSQARIGVCPLQHVPKFMINIPVKVFEYWACGLPVIASDLPPIRPYFRSTNAGLLFEPGNAADLARSIAWMLDHPGAADRLGRNGRAAVVERFNNQAEIHKFYRLCRELVPDRPAVQEPLVHG